MQHLRIKLKDSDSSDKIRVMAVRHYGLIGFANDLIISVSFSTQNAQDFISEAISQVRTITTVRDDKQYTTYWYFSYFHHHLGIACGVAASFTRQFPLNPILDEFHESSANEEFKRIIIHWSPIDKGQYVATKKVATYFYQPPIYGEKAKRNGLTALQT